MRNTVSDLAAVLYTYIYKYIDSTYQAVKTYKQSNAWGFRNGDISLSKEKYVMKNINKEMQVLKKQFMNKYSKG